ncbi:acyltransferase family protein [Pseudomonas sp. GCM10022188]|uniref:acyltransferase family protein n=1 Tax=Pseudomonas TaxID=286 RepID=UPI001E548AFF|nr:acyltransferase family protein [Pseudomonas oryzagri]MCC6076419.1 acyltransferase [Pseudomonas oryzagri]
MATITYRPDIDGLRAVAVSLVVLNHFGIGLFSGGFVGVDVFFVISGYLITNIISSQMAAGVWSFGQFYTKRAFRLLPALYVMLGAVLVAGYFFYLPADYSLLAKGVLSSLLFSANIFFWQNSGGYFSPDAEEMPLLHIWSLSVEEQFYFCWPFLFYLAYKFFRGRALCWVILASALLSFWLSEVGVERGYSGAYFLLPFRAGELLLGCSLALFLNFRGEGREVRPVVAEALSFFGLFLIFAAAVLLGKGSSFPGINAFIPCLGAALVIAAPSFGRSLGSRILSLKPFVFIGLISYSLYLWHWPVASILRYLRVDLTPLVALGAILSSVLIGFVSWYFVERPFRTAGQRKGRMVAIAGALAISFVFVGPVFVYLKNGLPERFPYAMLTQEQLDAERLRYWVDIKTKDTSFAEGKIAKQVLVVGNSHAYDFSYALTENDFVGTIKLIETTFHCFNFGFNAVFPDKADLCREKFLGVIESPELRSADVIYLHDNWSGKDFEGLVKVLQEIRQVTSAPIYVVGPKMTFDESALNISKYAQSERIVTASGINQYSRGYQRKNLFDYDRELKDFFAGDVGVKDVHYISALDVQCGAERRCDILSEDTGEYLYFDTGHFTLAGARDFGKKLKKKDGSAF